MCLLRLAVDKPSPWSRKQTGANSATKWPEAEASFVQGPIATSRFPLKTMRARLFSLDACRGNDLECEPSGMLQGLHECSFKQPSL